MDDYIKIAIGVTIWYILTVLLIVGASYASQFS